MKKRKLNSKNPKYMGANETKEKKVTKRAKPRKRKPQLLIMGMVGGMICGNN